MWRLLLTVVFALPATVRQCDENKSKKTAHAASKVSMDTLHISIKRTGCYGRCPIDKVELLPDGTVEYHGERFVPRIGIYKRRLSDKELQEVRQMLKDAQFEQYQELYDNPHITDLPSLILSYQMGATKKQITCRTQCPPELPEKVEKIRTYLAEQGDFQMIKGPSEDEHAD